MKKSEKVPKNIVKILLIFTIFKNFRFFDTLISCFIFFESMHYLTSHHVYKKNRKD